MFLKTVFIQFIYLITLFNLLVFYNIFLSSLTGELFWARDRRLIECVSLAAVVSMKDVELSARRLFARTPNHLSPAYLTCRQPYWGLESGDLSPAFPTCRRPSWGLATCRWSSWGPAAYRLSSLGPSACRRPSWAEDLSLQANPPTPVLVPQ